MLLFIIHPFIRILRFTSVQFPLSTIHCPVSSFYDSLSRRIDFSTSSHVARCNTHILDIYQVLCTYSAFWRKI